MTYHLSSEQYQRGIDYIAWQRVLRETSRSGLEPTAGTSWGMAELLAHLASVTPARVMRDSDARLADLDSPLSPIP